MISPLDFHIVRSYLERFEDLAILADVVGIATSSLDSAVLAAAADTINYHVRAFRAMGACDPLFSRISSRYNALRTIRFPERELLLSLSNLARVVQAESQLLQTLSYDMSRLDQKNSLAACSPASDNMGEVMQISSNSHDEIERILSSGTSMDQQMMARVLRKIINNLQEHAAKGHIHFDNYPAWFHRLRSFDERTFDMVASEWLSSALAAHQVDILWTAIPTLVGSGCVGLNTFLDILYASVVSMRSNPSEVGFRAALEGLRTLLPSEDLVASCPPLDAYRYRLEQRKLGARTTLCIGEIIGLLSTFVTPTVQSQVSELLASQTVVNLMKHCAVSDPGGLSKMSREATGPYLKVLFDSLLDPFGRFRKWSIELRRCRRLTCILELSEKSPEQQVLAVFGIASELSLPICQVVIEQIFTSDTTLSGASADVLPAALLSAIRTAVDEDQSAGLELLASLDATLTDQVILVKSNQGQTQLTIIRYDNMPNEKFSMLLRFSPCLRVSRQKSHNEVLRQWYRSTLQLLI